MKTILLVDDEESVGAFLKVILVREGYEVLFVHNGREAIDLFAANTSGIDIILMDVHMPEMNGIEAYDKIQDIKLNQQIVYMSAYPKDQFQGIGNSVFLQKPFHPSVLLKTLKDIIGE